MDKFRFLHWKMYQDARDLSSLIFKMVKKLPRDYHFELGNQIIRSAFSIILNIAEGSGKKSNIELNRFLNIALGSLNETLAGVDVFRYNHFITEEEFQIFYDRLMSISSQIGAFQKNLKIRHKS